MSTNEDAQSVLASFIGTWDIESPGAKGVVTRTEVFGGRFIQGNGSLKTDDGSNDFDLISMMTFDPQGGVFRTWNFLSNGMVSQSESTWDGSAQTMTEVTRYGEITQTSTTDLSQDGVHTWTMVNTDASGAVIGEMTGTNTRRGAT